MIEKQPIAIPFSQGLSQKEDSKQIPIGRFARLKNTVFTKIGLLQKRPGYKFLTGLPNSLSTYATTFQQGLTAIGTSIEAYSAGSNTWFNMGPYTSCDLSVLPVIRSATNQTQCDSVTATNGLSCIVFTDTGNGTTSYKYTIVDNVTGQVSVSAKQIPVSSGVVTGSPRVFLLGNYFVIVFTNIISSSNHLQYIAISTTNPKIVTTATDITNNYMPSSTLSWDAVVAEVNLYIAYNTTSGGQAINYTYLSATQAAAGSSPAAAATLSSYTATVMSLCADTSGASPVIWITFYNSATTTGYTFSINSMANVITTPVSYLTSGVVLNLATVAQNQVLTIYQEIQNSYSFDSSVATNYIQFCQVSQSGSVTLANAVLLRSVGLASKAFLISGVPYFLAAYSSAYQPSYFLVNASGNIIGKLAYSNGGGYLALGLPGVTIINGTAIIAYLYKDLVTSVNKTQGLANSAGIYSQTGVNLATFDFLPQVNSSEVGGNLNITGAQLWTYDGQSIVEQGFQVWPDMDTNLDGNGTSKALSVSSSGGSMSSQLYFYQVVYSWTDNTGRQHYSAPSIPIPAAAASFSGSSNSVTINIPTLRLTSKISNPVQILIYRWSTNQLNYYQVTSVSTPLLNNTSVDSVQFVDTLADASILGNALIYTTGGVIENIAAPSAALTTLYQGNLVVLDAEDRNLLWVSKPIQENVPVELSDFLTIYVSPTTGAQGSTGYITALSAMDDKLIVFKKDAIYYITGQGFNALGQGGYSEPIFITSTVGCANQRSIVMTPNGLLFQSDKGIWLLGRDLSTEYIGNPVEDLTSNSAATSAVCIPGTNYVLFGMDSGIDIIYDYFVNQWGTHEGTSSVSGTLYQDVRLLINKSGQVLQQTPQQYLDGSKPVQIGLTTGWLNLAGLQGYQRAYFVYLLGEYISPHKLVINVAYDYDSNSTQQVIITPTNSNDIYGSESPYGYFNIYGGGSDLEVWKIHLARQKCQAFQFSIDEISNLSLSQTEGASLSLSGLNLVVGIKKGYYAIKAANTAG